MKIHERRTKIFDNEAKILMPNEREILKVKKEGNELVMWVLYEDTEPWIEHDFVIIKTEELIPFGYWDLIYYGEVAPGEFLFDVEED